MLINQLIHHNRTVRFFAYHTQKTKEWELLERSKWNPTNTLKNDVVRYVENNEQIKEEWKLKVWVMDGENKVK